MVMVSDRQLRGALSLRARVALRRELQGLVRAHSAACAFLWTCSPGGGRVIGVEFAGQPAALPRSGALGTYVPTCCQQRTVVCADREERELVFLAQPLCSGAPTFALGLVDARAQFADPLIEDVERAMERIEDIIVDQVEDVCGGLGARQ